MLSEKARVLQPRKLKQVNNHPLQALALGRIWPIYARTSPSPETTPSRSASSEPRMTVTGVLSSCEIVAKNALCCYCGGALVPPAGVVKAAPPEYPSSAPARRFFVLPRVLHPRVVFAARQPARKALNRRDRLGEHARKSAPSSAVSAKATAPLNSRDIRSWKPARNPARAACFPAAAPRRARGSWRS